jgi:DNA replication protein DnaC
LKGFSWPRAKKKSLLMSGKQQLVDDVRAAWGGTDRWLLLTGPVGLGKTGLAVSLLLEAMRAGSGGLYVVTPSFLSRIRATYTRGKGDDETDEMAVLASVIEAPVLVLDDLGKVTLTEWGQEKLFTLVNERYIAGRRTIVTSNLDTEDGSLEGHLWPATWDRIRGMSEVFRLTGSSLR